MRSAIPYELLVVDPVLLQSIDSTVDEHALPITAITSLFLLLGLVNLYLYRSNEATADRLEQTAVSTVDSLADGPAAVSGVARPAADTLERPTTDGECLAYERRTRVKRRSVDNDPAGERDRDVNVQTTNSSSSESTAFYVEDDTGTVLVSDDETPTLYLDPTDTVTETPDDLETHEQRARTRDSYSYVTERTHRYYELRPGDEVFVFGEARRDATGDGGDEENEARTDARITEHDETGDFIVTTNDREWLVDRYTDRVQLVVGLVLTLLSVAFLSYVWVL